MADRIELIGLQGYGYHGVFEQEKREGQDFLVDIVLWTDFSVAAASDNLADTVSYADLAEMAMEVITGPARDLIETVASEIADRIPLSESVHAVEVTVHKPQAPVGHSFQDVRVVARRSRRGERLRVAKGQTGND